MSVTRPREGWGQLYVVTGPWCTPETHDEDCRTDGSPPPAFEKLPPTARITTFAGSGGGPLLMAWLGQTRVFDGGDSYENWIPDTGSGSGGVAGYAWDVTGATISGSASGSGCTIIFDTLGTAMVELTVTDGNGVEGRRRLYVRVVQRPHLAGPGEGPIANADLESLSGALAPSGWGGYSGTVIVRGPYASDAFQRGQMICLFGENHYDGVLFEGEIFSGWVLGVDPVASAVRSEVRLTIGTGEAFLSQPGVDCMDFGLISAKLAAEHNVTSVAQPDTSFPWFMNWGLHWLPRLSVGVLMHHVLWKHVHIRIGSERYPATEIMNFVREWWQDWDAAGDDEVFAFNMPRGRAMGNLAACLPSGAWAGFCDRHSTLTAVRLQPGKPTADASGGTITRASALEDIELVDGQDHPVRAVIVTPVPAAFVQIDLATFTRTYPTTPGSQGGIDAAPANVWVATEAAADRIAEARYRIGNATKGARVHLPGVGFTLHNVCQLTATGGRFTWTNKRFFVVADAIERTAGRYGMLRQRLELREVDEDE